VYHLLQNDFEYSSGFARSKIKIKNTLFSLGMFTYTYERQVIIQIALKRLSGGGSAVKKGLSDLALPLNVVIL
jgi:hypothetical protein